MIVVSLEYRRELKRKAGKMRIFVPQLDRYLSTVATFFDCSNISKMVTKLCTAESHQFLTLLGF